MRATILAALCGAALLGVVPTPYWIIAPGSAVDLSQAVAVEGHAPSVDRFYLTDVSVQHANALLLLAGLVPGVRLVKQDAIVPSGVPRPVYDRRLADAMDESQDTAAVVAERAAGFRVVDPPPRLIVSAILAGSHAGDVLRAGDEVVTVGGRRISALGDITRAVERVGGAATIPMQIRRGASQLNVRVPTIRLHEGTRLGILIEARPTRALLPVPVRYSLDNVSGSSGGLMFALAIYSALRPDRRHAGTSIAGTGTIAADGEVGPIEGTLQKLIAAKRVGARIFLVPRQNFPEIASEHEVRIVPVGSFRDALAALPS